MKQRFSSLDVKVIAHELSASLVSLRLSNIYDLSTRIFLLKFAKPEHREQLLIDSGFRAHLTSYARATASAPSPFVTRLRKYLKTRRVTSVSQVGTDRIIEIQFSDGAYRLFLEFYAGGNIVLTDNQLTIIALLRNVDEGAEHERYRLGLTYNLSLRQNYEGIPPLTKHRLRSGLQKAIDKQSEDPKKAGKLKKKPGDALRKALAVSITEFPPVIIDHALELVGFDKTLLPSAIVEDDALLDKLMRALEEAGRLLTEITSRDVAKGYIIAKHGKQTQSVGDENAEETQNLLYDDFHPFKPKQLEAKPDIEFLEFEGFNKTVDEFFSSIEGQKLESKLSEREENAKKRIEQARQEHARRIAGLEQVQELNVRRAQAIEANLDRVEEAAAAVNGLVAQGMDWLEIDRLIEMEQSRHNPVAQMIRLPLKLQENIATLLVSEYAYEEEDDDDDMADETDSEPSDSEDEGQKSSSAKPKQQEDKRLAVDIDLGLSAWSNARQYYDQRKSAATKQEKTEMASSKALKSTEAKIQADLKKGLKQEKQILRPVRKQLWFEKFIHFISSDGYLVLGGKDAQQSEMLYRKYLKKGDIYVHADLPGAASIIIRNNPNEDDAPIPPSTLQQAGNMSICTSNAWDSKAVMSAWWVNADQVSKTGPTGEYLAAGGFNIRGKKNYMPPAQLLLGFGIMFQISEDSKARHTKHRFGAGEALPIRSAAESDTAANKDDEDDDDDDDDFPDAGEAAEDSDDFPDAENGAAEESEDDDEEEQKDDHHDATDGDEASPAHERANPLQPKNLAPAAASKNTEASSPNEKQDASGSDSEDEDGEEAQHEAAAEDDAKPQQQGGVRHLSAKERRLKKKGKALPPQSIPQDSDHEENDTKPTPIDDENSSQKLSPADNKPQVRGKRGKKKKLATKYADQDEEDRRLAMQLLGSRAAEEKREAAAQEAAIKKETEEEKLARRRAQHERAQKEGLEAERQRQLALEQGTAADDAAAEDDDAAGADMTGAALDAFIGTPYVGDELLEALPICAPWAALGKYKYKVKLQPGSQKKGKAVREILDRWNKAFAVPKWIDQTSSDKEKIWPREVELVKGFKEAEIIGVVPVSKVRVMMGGGAAAADNNKGKASKTASKKGGGRGGKGSKKR
ncbi:hypothetical protein AAFC00_001126 [Neodothiora populina]|uniref:Serologically defined colon cancer antigen 1 n=1 Tax=Neodothiora populina TaxID=2781224 RepID=A0ABR3PMW4_9PEZI